MGPDAVAASVAPLIDVGIVAGPQERLDPRGAVISSCLGVFEMVDHRDLLGVFG